ncbi:putative Sec20 [Trypanosoma vivax]|uniref:Sec20 C-terminal domain-containing protein n=1 Tax=Trypanosoma vivax (strain Y486) TaxID=1055687 RepID=G0UBP3_TRYVY|nr:hypothetical protein TRVL_02927 [Trypanosoma vivax]KAH8609483.1 putative Sec20 [Trypanosoma vivax]CCC53240.1 conserved hypothetical protein [Trypanosoma vivax Y486]
MTSSVVGDTGSSTFSEELHANPEVRVCATLAGLNLALKMYQENRNQGTYRALAQSVASTQRLLRLVTSTLKDLELQQETDASSALATLITKLQEHRAAIHRVLHIAVGVVEVNVYGTAKEKTDALHTLLHTRRMLNGELRKVQGAVNELSGSSKSLELLHYSLQDLDATVDVAQRVVQKLLSVKTWDDLLLKISILFFLLTVSFIVAQRIFGFFPVVL